MSLLVQAGTLIRTLQLSSQHGASKSLDAFYLANAITVSVFNIVGSAVSMVLVPEFVSGSTKNDTKRYLRWINRAAVILAVGIGIVVFLFRETLFGGGPADYDLGSTLVIILLTGQLFRISTALNTAALQARERFFWPRALTLVPAFVPVAALLWRPDLRFVCLSLTVAYSLEALGNHLAARKVAGLTKPGRGSKDPRQLLGHTWPIIGASALFQVQVVAMMIVVSRFGAGAVTTYSNAYQLVGFVQIVLIQNLLMLIYPRLTSLVQMIESWSTRRFSSMLSLAVALSLSIILAYVAFGFDAVNFLFARGAYSPDRAKTVYEYGLLLLVALPFGIVREVLYRILYACGKSRAAALNAVLVVACTLIILVSLVASIGVYAVFVSLACASVISAFGAYRLVRRLGYSCNLLEFWRSCATYLLAIACAVSLIHFTTEHLTSPLRPVVATVVAASAFLLMTFRRIRQDLSSLS